MAFPLIPLLIGGGIVLALAVKSSSKSGSGTGIWSDGLADGALSGETTYTDSKGRYWVYGPIGYMTMMKDSSGASTSIPRPQVSMMGIEHRSQLATLLDNN